MSPRRRFAPGEAPLLSAPPPEPQRPRGLPVAVAAASVLALVAVAVSALMLGSHESRERAASRDREVLNYVTGFMAGFTSLVVARWHGRFVHVPMPLATRFRKQVDTHSDLWMSVVESTGQPVSWDSADSEGVDARRAPPVPTWSVAAREG